MEDKGFEVFDASQVGRGESDEYHLDRASELDAFIITRDDDFLSMISDKEGFPGVFYLTGFSKPVMTLESLEQYFDEDLGRGFVIYI